MLSSDNQKELIDAYLKGNLSPEETPVFEEHLRNNAFKNELDLQKSIVETLKANRKAELKNRLNAIDVSNTSANWWKYAAIIGLVSSVGLWFYMNKAETAVQNSVVHQEIENPAPVIASDEVANNSLEATKKPSLERNLSNQIASKTISEEPQSAKKLSKNKDKETLPNLPKLHTPDGAGVHEPLSKELDAPDHRLTQTPHLSTSVAGVEVVKSKKHKFHYRYFDNKLFLYGNFDANTYDILELNTSKGQSLYLKYEHNYYELEADKTEISKLEQVRDRQIAKELEEIQNK